jgi:lysophospholipase L1-like esterase
VATSNGMGFRGPEVSWIKPPGVIRIVLLGGSTTHGWGVEDGQTIDAHMRRLLERRLPGRRVEVVNLAFDGYDSRQLLERVMSDATRLSPDFLIVNAGINDVRNARFPNLKDGDRRTLFWQATLDLLDAERRRGRSSFWTLAKHHSYLLRLGSYVRRLLASRRQASDGNIEVYAEAANYFELNLRRIAKIAKTQGVSLIFSTPPSSLRTNYAADARANIAYWVRDAATTAAYRDTLARRMQSLAAELTAAGQPVTYLRPDVPPSEFLDDAHLTPEGNRTVAEAFGEAVVSPAGTRTRGAAAWLKAREERSPPPASAR